MWRADWAPQLPEFGVYRAALAALAAMVGILGLLLMLDWLLRADTMPVRNLRFEGEFRHVTPTQLEDAVRDAVRGNFLLLDLDTIRAKVEALPWVHRASVRRSWPRDVAIQFTEQRPVARWGESAWVNYLGEEIRVDSVDLPADAPLLAGPSGTSALVLDQYQRLRERLASAGIGIRRLTMTVRRTWEIELTALRPAAREAEGMLLIVDREDAEHKVERFARLYTPLLAAQAGDIRQIDLRYRNGLAVQWRNGGPRPRDGRLSKTPAVKEG
jgi:cell division protein FtsQ